VTQVATLVGGAGLLTLSFNKAAYVNVHLSDAVMGTILAQGNIGASFSNVESKTYNVTNSGSSSYFLTVRRVD
jgi:hypothetical protein